MDKEQAKAKAAVLLAFAEGKTIEFRRIRAGEQWVEAKTPGFNFVEFEYRVAPAPRRLWRIEIGDPEKHTSNWGAYRSADAAKEALPDALRRSKEYQIVEYVQVMR